MVLNPNQAHQKNKLPMQYWRFHSFIGNFVDTCNIKDVYEDEDK